MARALVLPDAPDAASGEITDKGYIAQALARRAAPAAVAPPVRRSARLT